MTRKKLKNVLLAVIAVYTLVLTLGIAIYYLDNSCKKIHYQIYKDLIPFTIAIPAAYLGFCFQQRSSFLQSLRLLWSNLILAVNDAIQYTHLEEPTVDQFSKTMTALSKCIDEVRGVYKNLGETPNEIGLYPFECLKDILKVISKLGYNKIDTDKKAARAEINECWREMRQSFLAEFDRSEPTKFHSPYV